MIAVNQSLLILHLLGMAMGLAVPLSNMVLQGLIAKAAPPEQAALARFPPLMSRIGEIGLALLWTTGLALVYTKWGGFGAFPWQFQVKLTAVVILTLLVGYIQILMRKARNGDRAAAARIPTVGRFALLASLTAVVFAVLTFD